MTQEREADTFAAEFLTPANRSCPSCPRRLGGVDLKPAVGKLDVNCA
ncbi:hypothetical protein ABTZ93_36095 [Streptomyces sp. NPDC097941]